MMNKKLTRPASKSRADSKKPTQTLRTSATSGFIRIIAGKWRGRKLPVHDVEGLRPTTDRIKETVFNWLMQDVRQAQCLDCFAGSGGLGFEALSRSAQSVIMIEKDPLAAKQLQQNLTALAADNGKIVKADCMSYLLTINTPFDLVFIDPPFRHNLAEPVCHLLEKQQLLRPSALIYVEIETELSQFAPPANWQLLKEKTAGQVSFRLYQRD